MQGGGCRFEPDTLHLPVDDLQHPIHTLSAVGALLMVLVPCLVLSHFLKLGSVVGLICAGVICGVSGLGLVEHPESLESIAEFGVVLFLFLVGLQLGSSVRHEGHGQHGSWKRWALLGVVQMLACGAVLTLYSMPFSRTFNGSLITGLTLAMSSTAIALQAIRENGAHGTRTGSAALAILLVQDLAVVPILALMPLLLGTGAGEWHLGDNLRSTATGALLIGGLAATCRFLIPPLLEWLRTSGGGAAVAAMVALVVVGASWLANYAGLSMSLGAFVAGAALSSSRSTDIVEKLVKPHQSLLLAVFFVAVGLSINLEPVVDSWASVLLHIFGIIALKIVVLFGIGLAFRMGRKQSLHLAVYLSQVGEFGFVITTVSADNGWITPDRAAAATVVIAVSMAITPLLVLLVRMLPDQPPRHK